MRLRCCTGLSSEGGSAAALRSGRQGLELPASSSFRSHGAAAVGCLSLAAAARCSCCQNPALSRSAVCARGLSPCGRRLLGCGQAAVSRLLVLVSGVLCCGGGWCWSRGVCWWGRGKWQPCPQHCAPLPLVGARRARPQPLECSGYGSSFYTEQQQQGSAHRLFCSPVRAEAARDCRQH